MRKRKLPTHLRRLIEGDRLSRIVAQLDSLVADTLRRYPPRSARKSEMAEKSA
jgi:hypothetical protein